MLCEYYNRDVKEASVDLSLKEAFERIRKSHTSAMKEMVKTGSPHILYSIRLYSEEGILEKVHLYRNKHLSDEELDLVIKQYPGAFFDVVHNGSRAACREIIERGKKREIRPITLKLANAFIDEHHRHLKGTVGCKFAIGLYEGTKLIGVVICGRPVSRYLDDGITCEVNRNCTLGDDNACSMLLGAATKTAQAMGYKRIITYTLESESGTSLKASNFVCEGTAGGPHWTGSRNTGHQVTEEMKLRWVRKLA